MDTTAPAPTRLAALDGLRGVAIALVVLFHMRQTGAYAGSLGVDVFFPLSGFLITSLLLREFRAAHRIDLKRFYQRRTLRLYPALLASVALALLLGAALRGAALALTYTTNLAIAANPRSASDVLSPTWSLALEEQFYLAWPLAFVVLLPRIGRRALAAVTVAIAGLGWAVLLVAPPASAYFRPDARVGGLMVGCAIALVPTPRFARVGAGLLSTGLVLGTAAGSAAFTESGASLLSIPLVSAGVALLLPSITTRRFAALEWKPLVWVGERSYAIYLVNMPLIRLLDPSQELSTPQALLAALLIASAAHVVWRFVEQPALAWRDRMTNSAPDARQRPTPRLGSRGRPQLS